MKKIIWLVCMMVFVCMFSLTAVWAQEKKGEAEKLDPSELADFSNQVNTFNQVVLLAEANKDSLIMLSAVRILDSLPFAGVAKPTADGKSGGNYERNALLNQAKEYAGGDQEVLAMIAKLQEVPEQTDVRGRHHDQRFGHHGGGHRGGHGGGYHGGHGHGHGGYHGGGYHHPDRHRGSWHRECFRGDCRWVHR